ncbi:unnamed protein product, partial [Pleuronectes platessa]
STNTSVIPAPQIAVCPVSVFMCAKSKRRDRQHNSTCVVEGVTATTAPGNPLAESLKATQEELSPAEERLSSSLCCTCGDWPASPRAQPGERQGDLGGFGRE